MLALDLVEQAVDQLEASGSERAVVELCLLAEELEPLDERWPLRAGRAELAAGHTGAAARAAERARAVFADLDIPDEVLLPRIWPDGRAGRVELNTLVFRVRKDLVRADIDGPALLDRGDGATRFRLFDGAAVSLVRA